MSSLIKRWIPILLFAIFPGLIVLLGYLTPEWGLAYFRDWLVEGAVIVSAFAFLLGIFNVLGVHGGRVFRRRQGWVYSAVLLLTLLLAMAPPLLSILPSHIPGRSLFDRITFDYVITPLGASLGALLVFVLTMGVFRLLRTRRSAEAVLFLLVVVLVLLGSTPLPGLEWLAEVRMWIVTVPGMAGMRGLLLGVALGTVITALRVFTASERPYTEF
jgi:hypothetical protein